MGSSASNIQTDQFVLSGNTVICFNIGTPKSINFPFGTNGKLMVLGVLNFSILGDFFYKNNDKQCGFRSDHSPLRRRGLI